MLFNSVEFSIFLPIVFLLYWFVFNKSLKQQNIFLLAVSYFFYGWWDWRFLSLIAFSSALDFYIGVALSKTERKEKRKLLVLASLAVNLGFLGFFKYYNFFAEGFSDAFTLLGKSIEVSRLNIILPVGISFYTFQTLSYTLDVYNKKLKPTKSIISFFSFVSFFPQLVAGPIERASNLLPQFYKKREFKYKPAVDGLRQILWGLLKKIVIADNCAEYVNEVFSNINNYPGSTLVLAAIFFAFQIYGDFSGYSDIAIGTSRLFGFTLMQNFSFPYFSRDIAEFWRRWHISLSSWFKDYLYIPLGGSKNGLAKSIRNTFIIFIVSGFWHGANWTFIVWGALNAIYILPLLLMKKNRTNLDTAANGKIIPTLKEFIQITFTFSITVFAWIFFRSESISKAFKYINRIFSKSFFSPPKDTPYLTLSFILFFLICEWIQRTKSHTLQIDDYNFPRYIRWSIYWVIIFLIVSFGGFQQKFIYFDF